jgi:hypothetical protein
MTKKPSNTIVVSILAAAVASAQGQLIAHDGFAYTPGRL